MQESNKEITIQNVISKKKEISKRVDNKIIMKAYNYAVEHHGDQKRHSGEPYIIHPLNVAYILAEVGLDEATICAALLHDVVEDTDVTDADLRRDFSDEIADMVAGVTKLGSMMFSTVEEQQVEDYRKMFLAMGKDIRVIIIKLADRLHNMRTLKFLRRDRQIANSKETMEIYAPLANRLGLYSMKWELEDLAFKYLYPEEYHELVEGINKKREERLKFIEKIMDNIRVDLKKQHIDAEVTGRAKHLYSIYRKMQRDNKTLDQIYDLFALRILVNSVKDCYAALGIVHELYSPMPGRFKDYIAVPKPNMYQSIHTTLLGEKGTPFEVQIRTWDMHRIAEYGIAAHWAYKEANFLGRGKQVVKVEEDKLAWLRESLEWQKDMQDPQEFLDTLKTELFEDEVYVFTPKGAIKVLPRGATSIDFAYSIHAEIGHHMTGCKINSKMMPIITPLKSGDIVEIITSDNSRGPSRDWLKFVKSTSAKNKINSWFKKEQKEENIEKGKDLIEKEIKRIGVSHTDIFKNQYIEPMLDRYKYKDLEEMYAAVGFGANSAGKIVARILQEYRKEHEEENIEEKIEQLNKQKERKTKASSSGIVVKGIDNCLVKLSKCCNPLPGDEIIGYITKGRGVSVHRKDCINVNDLFTEENRIIDVKWYEEAKENYNVNIQVLANDRDGLLIDILNEINKTNSKLMGVNSKTTKERIAIIDINIEVENIEELNKVIRAIKKVDSVYEVRR
ncbi:MAG: bifunctional (p)ppGpp synthetase/guanosine-3',5'-bis(diphosphate) 3'-pyrophosphohydrolase [Clostridia bacterium]|jgi:guanosine-3',5'-bis(diphosphate) 3'-pyrophosphohydrolase|nr:bifunctional (p)ppGpp synthetase/guanosine-3',5'-bis(diphosphate) 3'-pyrophosphohydrolase [Clostridia bacterium]